MKNTWGYEPESYEGGGRRSGREGHEKACPTVVGQTFVRNYIEIYKGFNKILIAFYFQTPRCFRTR